MTKSDPITTASADTKAARSNTVHCLRAARWRPATSEVVFTLR